MSRVIHVEGIPGSGKSTASKRLCELLTSTATDAYWSLEESPDHPVMPKDRRRLSSRPDFPDVCLEAWRTFMSKNDRVAVLDGYALQTTIRHLYANLVRDEAISAFFDSWQAIGAGSSTMVFFTVSDPIDHFHRLLPERGRDWTGKLCAYVERTPLGRQERLRGRRGLVDFWSRYQDLCLDLLRNARMPTTFMEARSWSDDDLARLAAGDPGA